MRDELVAFARASFGWEGDIDVTAGPRGALGQMWRVEIGPKRYALKEIFAEPPTEHAIEVELEWARMAADCGVLVPTSHPDRDGRYLLTAPDGTWLRCYDWFDLLPVPRRSPNTPRILGELLAQLHRCAPAAADEPNGGGPPDPWFDRVPAHDEWAEVYTSGAAWVGRLSELLTPLQRPSAVVRPVDPGQVVMCHRDLHPQNVFADGTGGLVVVDCDDLGPAEPGRELARALFDWFCDSGITDLDGVRRMMEAYLREGGPGRIGEAADFSMLLACRLNFLLEQARLALDPHTARHRRQWAQVEIDEALRIMPTPGQLTDVLAVARDCCQSIP